MNPRLLILLAVLLVFLPGAIEAREIRLNKGEVFRDRDLTVICEGSPGAVSGLVQPIAVRECQYWDDFAKKCLFEKTTYSYGEVECVEECQYWDSFSNTCDYTSTCIFYPQQEAFVLKTCTEFDDHNRKCLKTREEKIRAGR
ncbi:MAG: hypothetical protein ACYC0O_09500 [Desulfurivibrionaceae bacterium]|jgi:hypothetical protein|nr:hypothetical protein [Pseudomonadota bacterium]MCG2824834.1 hypothetical protein [Desulfobulbaceae bacterium]MDP2003194.1 hypothetical protein [Desulfurivibrionaceae bacterium]PKN22403.1 MAG: hypothetical protein CVU68_04400 [Deltaproteobacteria bacterium HGW-Deltaproteobacteria-3]MBU4411682.1 hypothetical protein [Pseudomonadota bacterium]